ncbi:hypothetical protein [Bacillus sp. NPDC057893]|uniref:hypothetical protein n=1 Tax=Bacillus sp. NPDC057893 TaxID=3346273 RepID=UPI0036722948
MRGTWIKVCVCSSLVIIGILMGYVTNVIIQDDISESDQDQVNTFQDENSGHGTTKEYNEGEVKYKSARK